MKTSRVRLQDSNGSQKGMVAIFVTMIMMIVISLIVLGFAQVSRSEVRQSLDRQLSAQAYLAAETGVNDAVKAINDSAAVGGSVVAKNKCDYSEPGVSGMYGNGSKATIDSANNVKYTCMLVKTDLPSLHKSLPADGTSLAAPLHPAGNSLGTLSFTITRSTTPTPPLNCAGAMASPAVLNANTNAAWPCQYGVVRLDFVSEADYSRGAMAASQETVFLYPVTAGGTPTHVLAGLNGATKPMLCSTVTSNCTVKISGFASSPNQDYYMRAMAIYHEANLDITGNSGGPVIFQDAQAEIDVTGKAQDVLRRIQVRVPINTATIQSSYALESASSICKRFGVAPGYFSNQVNGQDARNPYCTTFTIP
jgi:hypothetical protein